MQDWNIFHMPAINLLVRILIVASKCLHLYTSEYYGTYEDIF
jgi:hypothetical protein